MTPLQIRQKILVTDFEIMKEGISIEYYCGATRTEIQYSPIESAKALKEVQVIEAWKWEGEEEALMVKAAFNDRFVWVQWEKYALEFGLYQYAALLIAIYHEMKEWAGTVEQSISPDRLLLRMKITKNLQ
jgi:hypothetical protein